MIYKAVEKALQRAHEILIPYNKVIAHKNNVNSTDYFEDVIFRLRKRAEIRRQIPDRKSVLNNEPDRLADLLEEAAAVIEGLI